MGKSTELSDRECLSQLNTEDFNTKIGQKETHLFLLRNGKGM